MDLDRTSWIEPPINLTKVRQFDHRQALTRWWRAVVIASCWLVGLLILSLWTANPITLNRMQILDADLVVKAIVEDWSTGHFRTMKSWKQTATDERLAIAGLPRDPQSAGTELLIPITHNGDRLTVTPSHLPNGAPLVYPATPESERQLQSLLEAGRLPSP